jgi:hypothetical protein
LPPFMRPDKIFVWSFRPEDDAARDVNMTRTFGFAVFLVNGGAVRYGL